MFFNFPFDCSFFLSLFFLKLTLAFAVVVVVVLIISSWTCSCASSDINWIHWYLFSIFSTIEFYYTFCAWDEATSPSNYLSFYLLIHPSIQDNNRKGKTKKRRRIVKFSRHGISIQNTICISQFKYYFILVLLFSCWMSWMFNVFLSLTPGIMVLPVKCTTTQPS